MESWTLTLPPQVLCKVQRVPFVHPNPVELLELLSCLRPQLGNLSERSLHLEGKDGRKGDGVMLEAAEKGLANFLADIVVFGAKAARLVLSERTKNGRSQLDIPIPRSSVLPIPPELSHHPCPWIPGR